MIITISGPPGSGKTTVAEILAHECSLHLISTGKLFRTMAENKRMSLEDFSRYAEKDENVDRELDKKIMKEVKRLREERVIVVEGRLAGHMVQRNDIKAFTVWIDAPLDIRAKRISDRDEIGYDEARRQIIGREKSEKSRYKRIYNIDLESLKVYDLIIDSQNIVPEKIVKLIRDEAGI